MTTLTEIHNLLVNARRHIEKEENWCKGELAKDAYGNAVNEASETACKFCAIGALYRESSKSGIVDEVLVAHARVALSNRLATGWECPAAYNDGPTTTHADVLAMYDAAITATKPKEG
jgi:hypothetical protein